MADKSNIRPYQAIEEKQFFERAKARGKVLKEQANEIHLLALAALNQVNEHGNTKWLDYLFNNAFGASENRQEFVFWVRTFSNKTVRFNKDKGNFTAKKSIGKCDMAKAEKHAWWDMPEVQGARNAPVFNAESDVGKVHTYLENHLDKVTEQLRERPNDEKLIKVASIYAEALTKLGAVVEKDDKDKKVVNLSKYRLDTKKREKVEKIIPAATAPKPGEVRQLNS